LFLCIDCDGLFGNLRLCVVQPVFMDERLLQLRSVQHVHEPECLLRQQQWGFNWMLLEPEQCCWVYVRGKLVQLAQRGRLPESSFRWSNMCSSYRCMQQRAWVQHDLWGL